MRPRVDRGSSLDWADANVSMGSREPLAMSDFAIRADALSKQYVIGGRPRSETLRDHVDHLMGRAGRVLRRDPARRDARTFWALENVSFEVQRGEAVGIIGRNGAGKSTLLKILSRITEPTSGFAEIAGRVGSLLEVGTGFHPELSGRENIYLNGAILGMKKSEIERIEDDIIAFAEVERFIGMPVKRYSSGMYTRLAFAVAAHLQPEILIVDEVLAVGDAQFQRKCLGKMGDVAREGRTVLFVSHNMGAITQLCERALWLNDGQLKLDGPAPGVVTAYLSSGSMARSSWEMSPAHGSVQNEFQFTSVRLLSADGRPLSVVEFSSPSQIEIGYDVCTPLAGLTIHCRLTDATGTDVWTSYDTDSIGWKDGDLTGPGRYVSVCKIPPYLLRPALYHVFVGARTAHATLADPRELISFEVSNVGYRFKPGRRGVVTPLLDWEVKPIERPRSSTQEADSCPTD